MPLTAASPTRSATVRRRTGARRFLVAAGLTLMAAGLVPTAAAGAATADPAPTMSVSPAIVERGQPVIVSVAGWPAGSATASVCGDSARRGDDDCDGAHAAAIAVGDDGSGSASVVAAPPGDCPCVVRVSSASGDLVQTLPLQLSDAPPTGADATTRQLAVTARVLPPTFEWSSAFGLDAHRTLEVTVRNTGSAPIDGVAVEAVLGRPGAAGRPLASPAVDGALSPGEQRVLRVPFELTTPAAGTYVASGRVTGLDQPVTFRATTATQPWALAVVVLAVALGAVGWWIGARRDRRRRATTDPTRLDDDQVARR